MDTSQHLTDLRRKAEEQLAVVMSSLPEKSPEDMQALVHDLHVHQIELTLQNEELRRIQTELEVSRMQYADLYNKYANLYEFAPVGYCTLDESGVILEMNLTAAKQLGIQRDTALRARIYQYIVEDDHDSCFVYLHAAFSTGLRQTCELQLLKQDGTCFWAQLEGIVAQVGSKGGSEVRSEHLSALPQGAETSTTNYCLVAITDITDRKHAEEQLKISFREKDMLMQEILHRTKNNMGAIISLMHLLTLRHQEHALMAHIFQEIEQRILAMLLVQQKLYQSGNYTSVDLKEYLEELTPEVFHSLQVSTARLHLTTEPVVVSPDTAITCGLLLNEVLTNALKYAFPPDGLPDRTDEPGQPPDVSASLPSEICVTLQRIDAKTVELHISDNGVGLPEDFDIEHPKSLGLSLIDGFVRQLQGTFEVTGDHGTHWRIRFPQHS